MSSVPPSPVTNAWLLQHFRAPGEEIEARIADGIETHRKGAVRVQCVDAQGRPVRGVALEIEQVRHEFLFGANSFMLDGFATEAENAAYRNALLQVANSAVLPFYWSDLEPQRGEPRFDADSLPRDRRPPIDLGLRFCEEHGLVPKGHCLTWHQWLPEWLPKAPAEAGALLVRRIGEISARYGQRIPIWDVVNEPMERHLFPKVTSLPDDYVAESFAVAARGMPAKNRLILNEATMYSWRKFEGMTTGLKLLLDDLLRRGLKIDGLGLQYHLFFYDEKGLTSSVRDLALQRDVLLNPGSLLATLDLFARSGRPINISEISLPTYPDHAAAEELQAELLRALYRLWFSHQAVEGIYWWNLADGGAYGPEKKLRAGLLRDDLSPKPAFGMLRRLIHEEWHSRFVGLVDEHVDFRGFYGDYTIKTRLGGVVKTHAFTLSRQSEPMLRLNVTAGPATPSA